MEQWRFLDLVILLLLALMFVMTSLIFIQTIGEGQLAFFGWLAVLVGIFIFARLISHQAKVEPGRWLDLLLIVIAASVYALLQASIMVVILEEDMSPLGWIISLMLILALIGLGLYRNRGV